MRKIRSILFILLLALLGMLTGCTQKPTGPQGKSYFNYFDTVSYVYSYAGDSAEQFNNRSAEVSNVLEEYHKLFDIYHEYSGMNNLCTVNRLAGGESVKVDEKLIDFMLYARELYYETQGEMDVMLGSVLSIWHDCRTQAKDDPEMARVPTPEELQQAAGHSGFSLLEIDEAAGTLRITDPEASIDVGALGKGYATEMAARYLESCGAQGYVLNIGGNIRIIGTKPDGGGWVTELRNPFGSEGESPISLELADTSCVTSGVYERYYTVDGQRYHHIIDRKTLYPADYYAAITVVTRDSALADALSTALFCMPYEDGLKMAESFTGVDVVWIFPDGRVEYTPGLEDRIENLDTDYSYQKQEAESR